MNEHLLQARSYQARETAAPRAIRAARAR